MTVEYTVLESPVGAVRVAWGDEGLVSVCLGTLLDSEPPDPMWTWNARLSCPATEQLEAYFAGNLRDFDLPLVLRGTDFQQAVWRALARVPFGETVSYSDLATAIGRPRAVRAVGAANGRNPIPIVLPCHRVIGRDGRLTGYAGGLDVKEQLLDFERRVCQIAWRRPTVDVVWS
jgi:methylated-DNA-[protein]-cysteine S-methyltransferase